MKHGLTFLITLALHAVALCSLAGVFAGVVELLDLFNHFRPQAVAAAMLLGLLALVVRRPLAWYALLIIVFNSGLMAQRLYKTGAPQAQQQGRPLRIMASNVFTPNVSYAQALERVAQAQPDVVAFIETDQRWITELAPLANAYPHSFKLPRPDNFGMLVYAKEPFTARIEHTQVLALPIAVLEFADYRIISIHTMPPLNTRAMQDNRAYLKEVADIANRSDKPVAVVGDFNSTLWSDALSPLVEAGLKRMNPLGFAYTWPTQIPLLAIQIDHVLAKGMNPIDFKVLESMGSDHFPVLATVELQSGNQQK